MKPRNLAVLNLPPKSMMAKGLHHSARSSFVLQPFLCVLLIQVLLIQAVSTTSPGPGNEQDRAVLQAPVINATSVTLNWTLPQIDETFSYYNIKLKNNGTIKHKKNIKNDTTTVSLHTLIPCMEYEVILALQVENFTTIRNESTLNFTTPYGAPPAVTSLATTNISSMSLALSWERLETGCNIIDYRIITKEVKQGTNANSRDQSSSSSSVLVERLQPHTKYNVSVTAYNEAGPGEEVSILVDTKHAAPSAPTKLEIAEITPNTITVTWNEPAESNDVLGSYNVRWYESDRLEGETNEAQTHFTIMALLPCVEYTVLVAATTGAGMGEAAQIKTTTSSANPLQPCCSRPSKTQTFITWAKPNTSFKITNYDVSWSNESVTVNSSDLQYNIEHAPEQELSSICVAAKGEQKNGEKHCCRERTPKAEDIKDERRYTGTIVGVIATVVVAAIALVAFIRRNTIQNYLCSHHKETECSPSLAQRRSDSPDHPNDLAEDDRLIALRNMQGRTVSDVTMPELSPEEIGLTDPSSNGIRANNLMYSFYSVVEEYYSNLEARVKHQLEALSNPAQVETEFDQLNKESFVGESSVGMLPVNMRKNRYLNIIPFDSNRVRLRNAPENTTDYINASFVQSSVADDVSFIACQSPKSNSVSDFWWMVWEQNIRIVVMLARSDDEEKNKCTQYWPVLCEESYSSITIKTESKEVQGGLITRTMIIKNDNESRTVQHFQFISWPDFGVPHSEHDFLVLVKDIREHVQPDMRNIIVHCSAGVGRTGTFIALWQLQVQAERRLPGVDVRETVLKLRRHRGMLVQKPEQYRFLHSCFLKYLQEISIWKPTVAAAANFSEASRLTMDSAV